MRRAGPVRLRPILMTAVATMMAAVPSAMGLGPGAETRGPMADAIIGGLILSTRAVAVRRAGVLRAERQAAPQRRTDRYVGAADPAGVDALMAMRGRLPWMIPVPVRGSRFIALDRRYAAYNVETAPGRLFPFGATPRTRRRDELLLCDLQDNPDTSAPGRLGSGRAGVYRGKYLKGVGRTLLAGNWADPDDLVHHTGHLRASAAARELLVSVFLQAKGLGDVLNPCETVLVRRKDRALRSYLVENLERRGVIVARRNPWSADLALQAISVKPAGFARYSNLLWLAQHLDLYRTGTAPSLAAFVELFLASVEPGVRVPDPTPDTVAQAFARAVDRGLERLHRCWRIGVTWTSLHNNLTADARFLDLEAPVILGVPLVGLLGTEPRDRLVLPHRAALSGIFEPYAFVLHMRMIAWALRSRFAAIARAPNGVTRSQRDYAHGLAAAFGDATRGHVLFSRGLLIRRLLGWLRDSVEIDRRARAELARVFAATYDVYLADRPVHPEIGLVTLPARLARGQTLPNVAYVFDFIAPTAPSAEAQLFNELVAKVDEIADPEALARSAGRSLAAAPGERRLR